MRWAVFVLCTLMILLISCSVDEEVNSIIETNETPSINEEVEETECTASWKCVDNKIKAYQLSNCTLIDHRKCPLGCENNTCKEAEVCEAGFKCKGDYYRAYQLESCDWLEKTKCEYGCNISSNECNEEPEESETQAEVAPEEPVITYHNLKLGETKSHSLGGTEYTLSIYNIDDSQVQISINGKRSNWIEERANYTTQGITIEVKGIYFQSYAGGKKEIDYLIS